MEGLTRDPELENSQGDQEPRRDVCRDSRERPCVSRFGLTKRPRHPICRREKRSHFFRFRGKLPADKVAGLNLTQPVTAMLPRPEVSANSNNLSVKFTRWDVGCANCMPDSPVS
jgi:hypothetical protein